MTSPDQRFTELCENIARMYPSMPLKEIFEVVRFNFAKEEFRPDNEQYLKNLVTAHARHRFTNYDKSLSMREKFAQPSDMPRGLRDIAFNIDRMYKKGELNDETARQVWGIVAKGWYFEDISAVVDNWSQP